MAESVLGGSAEGLGQGRAGTRAYGRYCPDGTPGKRELNHGSEDQGAHDAAPFSRARRRHVCWRQGRVPGGHIRRTSARRGGAPERGCRAASDTRNSRTEKRTSLTCPSQDLSFSPYFRSNAVEQ